MKFSKPHQRKMKKPKSIRKAKAPSTLFGYAKKSRTHSR